VHPGLKPELRDGVLVLRGRLLVDRKYQGVRLGGEFQVEIIIPEGYPADLPEARLTDNSISRIMSRRSLKSKEDLHVQLDNALCLCAPAKARALFPNGANLRGYEELLSNFLYGLRYYEEFGRWPWGEHSHGLAGLLESCAERVLDPKEEVDRINQICGNTDIFSVPDERLGRRRCVCGSGREFQRCHPEALRGLRCLRAELKGCAVCRPPSQVVYST